MNVLGIDGGFACLGLAAMNVLPDRELLLRAWVVETEKADDSAGVRVASDLARRAAILAAELELAINTYSPVAIALEEPICPRSATVTLKMGLVYGVVFGAVQRHKLHLVMTAPIDLKIALCRSRKASKEAVCLAIDDRFPGMDWPRLTTLWQHAADAVGVVLASLDSLRQTDLRRRKSA